MRRKDATPFLAAYEKPLETYRTDRGEVEIWRQDEGMAESSFGPGSFEYDTKVYYGRLRKMPSDRSLTR